MYILTVAGYVTTGLLGVFERDYDAVIRFLDDLPDDNKRALDYGDIYQLAGQPDLAASYFEVEKERLEQQLASQNFPDARSRQLMRLASCYGRIG